MSEICEIQENPFEHTLSAAWFLFLPHAAFHVSLRAGWIKAFTLDLLLHLCARLSLHLLCWIQLHDNFISTVAHFWCQMFKLYEFGILTTLQCAKSQ